ncbi:hypothetical protein N752_02095 [Desulforamulus aquiferis]|nr:hypothetical protein [Desulforamulus aquiferis]RYD06840.1 hypothetical protein N752_02095 [Desulforamulus aquiferis]
MLETVTATGLLAVLIVSFSGVMSTALFTAHIAREQSVALYLAQAKMEEILSSRGNQERTASGSFEQFPGYVYEYKVEKYKQSDLLAIKVQVLDGKRINSAARWSSLP